MRSLPSRLMLAAVLVSSSAFAQSTTQPAPALPAPTLASTGRLSADRRAALLEVVPPAAIQQSPAAIDLTDRLMRKHILLLQHPSLIEQVMQSADVAKTHFAKRNDAANVLISAMRVRIIPETNVIELLVDPAVAGDESALLAEAIIDQHLLIQSQLAQSVDLQRAVMLNNLKQRYQFRKDELSRDLREKAVRLSIDGMGTPGRLSAKEVELNNALQLSFELERKKSATSPDAVAAIDAQMKLVHERIDAMKQDLGDLTNAMNQYLVLKDDEATTRELLNKVNQQLEQISQVANTPQEVRWLCKPSRG